MSLAMYKRGEGEKWGKYPDLISAKYFFRSHGHVEEDGEKELVVDGHGDEPALVELGGRLPDHDAEPDPPNQEDELHWKGEI